MHLGGTPSSAIPAADWATGPAIPWAYWAAGAGILAMSASDTCEHCAPLPSVPRAWLSVRSFLQWACSVSASPYSAILGDEGHPGFRFKKGI
jgi:hypothetical protein